MAFLSLRSKYKKRIESEFDLAMEIGADFFSLVRAMFAGQLLVMRLNVPKKGDLRMFENASRKIK